MIATIDDNLIRLKFKFDYRVLTSIKALPDRKYIPETKEWTVPLEFAQEALPVLARLGFAGLDDVRVELAKQKALLDDLNVLAEADSASFDTKLPLYPFQRAIAKFMYSAGNSLNASFVGSGKTLTMLAVLEASAVKTVLIVCPKSVIGVWESEIKKWLPNTPISFTITNYEQLRAKPDNYNFFYDALVCDEVHRLGNGRTKIYQAISAVRSKRRFGLSATPLMNKVMDLWAICNWLQPGVMGSFNSFANRYCTKDVWGGLLANVNLDELQARMKRYMIRKTLDQVALELPARTIEDIVFDLSPVEQKLMKQLRQELLFEIEATDINKLNDPTTLQMAIVKMGKMVELGDSMELLGDSKTSTKISILKDHLRDTLVAGNKAVIFSRFERLVKILERELADYKPLIITGASVDRAEIVRQFQENDDNRLIIMTEAGSEGITLTRASYLYNIDLPWSVGKYEQRLGRVYRIGTTAPVFVYNLLARQSPDSWVQKKLLSKMGLAGAIYGDQPMTIEKIKQMAMYEDI